MKKKSLVNAIKLPSSKKIFGHDNGNYEEGTLIALLEEGLKKNLKSTDKIMIIEEYLPEGVCENPGIGNLKDRPSTITYGELNQLYENRFNKKYSPEEENERKVFDQEALMKSSQRKAFR